MPRNKTENLPRRKREREPGEKDDENRKPREAKIRKPNVFETALQTLIEWSDRILKKLNKF